MTRASVQSGLSSSIEHSPRKFFARIGETCDLKPNEIEITITETPRHNWGLRGQPGDEIGLRYRAEV